MDSLMNECRYHKAIFMNSMRRQMYSPCQMYDFGFREVSGIVCRSWTTGRPRTRSSESL
jgi:hypothetical protein